MAVSYLITPYILAALTTYESSNTYMMHTENVSKSLHVSVIFELGQDDFYVSEATHKAKMELSEEGTKSSAATGTSRSPGTQQCRAAHEGLALLSLPS